MVLERGRVKGRTEEKEDECMSASGHLQFQQQSRDKDTLRMLKDSMRNTFRYIEVYRPLAHGARFENDALVFVTGVQIGPRPP